MEDWKGMLQSKGVWGGVVALVGLGVSAMGFTLSTADAATLTDALLRAAGAVGTLMNVGGIIFAVYGRVVATKRIGTPPTQGA